jgi:multicomponent Na+:H+ antiporter subunit F
MTAFYLINLSVIMGVLALAMTLAFVRFALGPTLADRVVALDMMTIIGAGLLVVAGVVFGGPAFLDIALMLALIGFVSTAVFARYIERRHGP